MNILVTGYGQMGKLLVQTIEETDGFSVSSIVDPLGNTGVSSFEDVTEKPDVIIDFSHPSILTEELKYAVANNVPVLLATTGYTEEQLQSITTTSTQIPILHTSNTSYGIQVLLQAVKQLHKLLPDADIEVLEQHHRYKVDAPSGTANMIVDAIQEDESLVYGREGSSKRSSNEIGIHSVRGGTVAGYHEVSFFLNSEQITISHRAENKLVFVEGALKAVQFLVLQTPGLYSMEDVIKE